MHFRFVFVSLRAIEFYLKDKKHREFQVYVVSTKSIVILLYLLRYLYIN